MVSADFRVTQGTLLNDANWNLQQTYARLQRIQSQISSNTRIQKASDDPIGASSAMQIKGSLSRNTQIGRNISDAQGWLGSADTALSSVVEQLQHARDLALQAQNGTYSASELAGIAGEVDAVRGTVLTLANTKYGTRSIFAGTATGAAYDASANYIGRSAPVERTVAPGVRVQVNVNGDAVFGPAGNDVFSVLSTLSNDIRNGNATAISADIQALDTRTQNVQANLADIGARTQRVDTMKDRNDTGAISLKQSLGDVTDVDLPKALMDMQAQQLAYQAALATTAKAIQPSLVDFLR